MPKFAAMKHANGIAPKRVVWIPLVGAVAAGLFVLRGTDTPVVGGGTASRLEVGAGSGQISMQSDEPYGTFYVGPLCLSEPGEAKIVSVEPISATGGAEITDFSAFPFSQMSGKSGAELDRLDTLSQFKGSDEVSKLCGGDVSLQPQLALEIHNPGTDDAVVKGFRTTYKSNGKQRTVETPLSLGLCRSDSC